MQKCNLCINGKPIENHYIILDGYTQFFQSYDKIIAKFQNDAITVFDGWDTSRTTLKYFCRWLEQISGLIKLDEKAIKKAFNIGILFDIKFIKG